MLSHASQAVRALDTSLLTLWSTLRSAMHEDKVRTYLLRSGDAGLHIFLVEPEDSREIAEEDMLGGGRFSRRSFLTAHDHDGSTCNSSHSIPSGERTRMASSTHASLANSLVSMCRTWKTFIYHSLSVKWKSGQFARKMPKNPHGFTRPG